MVSAKSEHCRNAHAEHETVRCLTAITDVGEQIVEGKTTVFFHMFVENELVGMVRLLLNLIRIILVSAENHAEICT